MAGTIVEPSKTNHGEITLDLSAAAGPAAGERQEDDQGRQEDRKTDLREESQGDWPPMGIFTFSFAFPFAFGFALSFSFSFTFGRGAYGMWEVGVIIEKRGHRRTGGGCDCGILPGGEGGR